MPDIIEHGYLYIPQPPLFQAKKKGQDPRFFYTTNALKEANLDKSWEVSRFKGSEKSRAPIIFSASPAGSCKNAWLTRAALRVQGSLVGSKLLAA